MNTALERKQTPEERELDKKQRELADLEAQLADKELELLNLEQELHRFESEYIQKVGVLYAELDAVVAEISVLQAVLNPEDAEVQQAAINAQSYAEQSAEEIKGKIDNSPQTPPPPSDEIRTLFREVAKCIHPDLATNEVDRLVRDGLMAKANHAYKENDAASLRELLNEWANSPEAIQDTSTGGTLIKVIRKINQISESLVKLDIAIAKLKASNLSSFYAKVDQAKFNRRDLLAEMAAQATTEIQSKQQELMQLKEQQKSNV